MKDIATRTLGLLGLLAMFIIALPAQQITTSGGLLTNGAGSNIIPKSNGTNLVASSVSDNATIVTTSEEIDSGAAGTANGVFGLNGTTSGKATCTAPAVAGTSTNPVSCTNVFSLPAGLSSSTAVQFASSAATGMFFSANNSNSTLLVGGGFTALAIQGSNGVVTPSNGGYLFGNSTNITNTTTVDAAVNRGATGVVCDGKDNSGACNGTHQAAAYTTTSNCSSSAAPAVCGSAPAGSVVIAAAATTVTVNTTAVTANSQIILTADDTLGTKLGVTCNSTIATLVGGLAITARTGGTSFQITSGATPAVNPLCISYTITN